MPETAAQSIPALTDEDIKARVGSQSFERGMRYFHSGAIFDMRQQGMTVKARCHGSSGRPYRLRATFDSDDISEANCSCPVGAGGYCKHVAALLLTCRERPEEFDVIEELETTLTNRSKAELIALIQQMLRQEPELESLLEVPLPVAGTRSTPVDPAVYRRRAAAVFNQAAESRSGLRDVTDGLRAISSIADGFGRQGDHASAAAVYGAVILEALQHVEQSYDDDGVMSELIADIGVNLGGCLKSVTDAAVRETILVALFAVYRADIEIGGIGLSDGMLEIIFDEATREERAKLSGWTRAIMPGPSRNDWKRQAFGGFLLELEMDTLADEEFMQICRDTGRVHDLVDRLLSLGRIGEAVQAAQQVGDYDLLGLARIFDRHEQRERADELVLERSQTSEDTRIFDWLKDRYAAAGNYAAALELADKLFRQHPDLGRYRELRTFGQHDGQWIRLRPQILTFLGKQRWNDLLVAIHLDEGDHDAALKALRTIGPAIGYGYGLYSEESLAMRVARAAVETHPRHAIEIYQEQVERLIGGRNRNVYASAARLLVEVRDIYHHIDEDDVWSRYLADLRARNRSLRALKEEMAAAGL